MHLIYNAVYIIRTRREPVQPHLGSVLPGPEPVRQHANPRRALYSALPFRSNRQSSSAQSTAEYNRKCHSDWSINAHEVRRPFVGLNLYLENIIILLFVSHIAVHSVRTASRTTSRHSVRAQPPRISATIGAASIWLICPNCAVLILTEPVDSTFA